MTQTWKVELEHRRLQWKDADWNAADKKWKRFTRKLKIAGQWKPMLGTARERINLVGTWIDNIKFETLFFLDFWENTKRWSSKINVDAWMGFHGVSEIKNLPANAGDTSLIPGSRRFPREGNGNLLQYFCLGNSMDRGAWRAYSPWGCKRVGHNLASKQQVYE